MIPIPTGRESGVSRNPDRVGSETVDGCWLLAYFRLHIGELANLHLFYLQRAVLKKETISERIEMCVKLCVK